MTVVDDVIEAAAVRRLRGLVEWVDAGRPLTQTGRIRRKDALALVEFLETGDEPDPRYPIQSSSELPQLNLLLEWAKQCRLVRVSRGRLVAVGRQAGLLDRPPELVARMLAALPVVGAKLGHSVVMADAEHTVEAIFGELAGRGGSLPEERACEVAWNTAMLRFWFPDATEQQRDWQRRRSDGDVRWLLAVAADLGVVSVGDDVITLTAFGERCVRAWLGLGSPAARCLCVKVTLQGSSAPSIWRRLRIPSDTRLDRLHQVLGAAMGWQDSHLHVFERGSDRYGFEDPELDIRDERTMTLGGLLAHVGDRIDYVYDFGDDWHHELTLESASAGDPETGRAGCTDGGGRCPPEDVGGIHGYDDLKAVLADPDDDAHVEMLEWMGLDDACDFDPQQFARERADAAVASVPANRFH